MNISEKYYEYVNHFVNMKENVNKATDRKINKNTESDKNTSSQNQQKTDNCDSHHEKHNHEECDHKFDREKNIQNFFTEFKTNDEKKKCKSIICYCCQKKKHYVNKCTVSALIKNMNTQ